MAESSGPRTGPKNRVARKFNANVFDRKRNPMVHKPHPPGVHVGKRRKMSPYGQQLHEKQLLRALYGMLSQKQFSRYCKTAISSAQSSPEKLLNLLEGRLDIFCFRAKFGSTQFAARQLVSHGHVQVNGKKVDRPGYQLKPGDVVSIREKSKSHKMILEAMGKERTVPDFIDLNGLNAKYKSFPTIEQIPFNVADVPDFESVLSFMRYRS